MKTDERVKKCVAYIQYQMANGEYKNAGTVFFIMRDKLKYKYVYAVTAKHVVDAVASLGYDKIFFRLNIGNSTQMFTIDLNKWIYPDDKNVDIAITPFNFSTDFDHLYFPESSFLDEEKIKQNGIDCGDEVFITGLFKHHFGEKKNIPIVRVGNIAMMPEEKLHLKDRVMDAYLIECRSISGISGSPVFINYGLVREIDGIVKFKQGEQIPSLLGLVHGHFDTNSNEIDTIDSTTGNDEKINVGIAIVIPVKDLSNLLNSKEILQMQEQSDKSYDSDK